MTLQILSHMQIPLAERRGIPHHLIDILDPKQDFSAGDFYELSRAAIHDILQVQVTLHKVANPV